ncbi:MAG TPA: DNA gyrase modulator, partial [Pyrinomonadaceae bacterium]
MTTSRRDFIKTAGIAAGALSLPALPAWINSVVAAEEAAAAAVDKNALAEIALNAARKLGVTYADIRINRYRNEFINTRERQVLNVSRGQNFGFGVRVLYKGTWGFASSRSVTPEVVQRITQQAVEIARANSTYQRKRVSLVPVDKVVTSWKNAFEKDPFEVSIDDKIQFLLALNDAALKTEGVTFVNSSMGFVNEQKFYASTDGSRIEQYIIRANPSFTVTAVNRANGDFQTRSALGGPQGMGYEYLEKHDWKQEAQQAGQEAAMKLKAKSVDPGKYDL